MKITHVLYTEKKTCLLKEFKNNRENIENFTQNQNHWVKINTTLGKLGIKNTKK